MGLEDWRGRVHRFPAAAPSGELQSQKNRQERQEEERLETSGLSSSLLVFLALLAVQKIDFAILPRWPKIDVAMLGLVRFVRLTFFLSHSLLHTKEILQ